MLQQKLVVKPEIQAWNVYFKDVRFYSPESSYLIAGVQSDKSYFIVKGKMLPEGLVKLPSGKWGIDEAAKRIHYTVKGSKSYNEKFRSTEIEIQGMERKQVSEFTTNENLAQYLVKKLGVKGVGESTILGIAKNATLGGYSLLDVLNSQDKSLLLSLAPSRSAKKLESKIPEILSQWRGLKPKADYISPLIGFGLNPAQAAAAIDEFKDEVLIKVKANPYILMQKVHGVSWNTADKLAKTLGLDWRNKMRLRAALSYGMEQATSTGNIGVEKPTLFKTTMLLVNDTELIDGRRVYKANTPLIVPQELLEQELRDMLLESEKPTEETCKFAMKLLQSKDSAGATIIWYKPLLEHEENISTGLLALRVGANNRLVDKAFQDADLYKLAPAQLDAVVTAFRTPVSVLTGGPGCGKTHTLTTILTLAKQANLEVVLAAPTGKAAKRMNEATGHPASTLHSLIGAGGQDLIPIKADILIIDEASMVDVEILSYVLGQMYQVRNTCRLVLVGDSDQLPSVGAGQVLRDIINSGAFPVTKLTKIFRQKAGSGIIYAAKDINEGKVPASSEDGQFEVRYTEEPEKLILKEVENLLRLNYSPYDIQVLSPSHKGSAGCTALNNVLQKLCNPELQYIENIAELPCLTQDKYKIYPGDKVLNNKNSRALGIVNGDIGTMLAIDPIKRSADLQVYGSNLDVTLPGPACLNLSLAYAITVHKSQGAESPIVFVALSDSAKFMLNRNLLYTAITRGKNKVILFTSPGALNYALRKGEPLEGSRKTSLCQRLKESVRRKAMQSAKPLPGEPLSLDRWISREKVYQPRAELARIDNSAVTPETFNFEDLPF